MKNLLVNQKANLFFNLLIAEIKAWNLSRHDLNFLKSFFEAGLVKIEEIEKEYDEPVVTITAELDLS